MGILTLGTAKKSESIGYGRLGTDALGDSTLWKVKIGGKVLGIVPESRIREVRT